MYEEESNPNLAARWKRGTEHESKFKRGYLKLSPANRTDECRETFRNVKHELLYRVTLSLPEFNAQFILTVDASFDNLGAILLQLPPEGHIAR